jgi:transcriptional/translational regulatory protein YebC/TACO1
MISVEGITEDAALEAMMVDEIAILDLDEDDGVVTIIGEPSDLDRIKDALVQTGQELNFLVDKVAYLPNEQIELSEDDLAKMQRFLDMANELDDVQEIFSRCNLSRIFSNSKKRYNDSKSAKHVIILVRYGP